MFLLDLIMGVGVVEVGHEEVDFLVVIGVEGRLVLHLDEVLNIHFVCF